MEMRAVGVLLNSTGQVTQNLASVLMCLGQKSTNKKSAEDPEGHDCDADAEIDSETTSNPMRWCWYVGVSLLVIGALCVFASYPFAEQSLLGALISLQFISNIVFGRLLLGADITYRALLGTVIVIFGTCLCVSSAPKINPGHHDLRIEDLWSFALDNPPLWWFLIVDLIIWLGLSEIGREYAVAKKGGSPLAMSSFVEPFIFIAKAAIPGAFSIVAAKNLSIIVTQFLRGHENRLADPFFICSLIIWISGTTLWMRRMNAALGIFDGLFIIPLCQVTWSLCTILSGGFFFREFQSFDTKHLCMFSCGVCWNFAGVFLLQAPSGARESTRMNSIDGCEPATPGDSNPWWMGLARAGMRPCGTYYWKKERSHSSHSYGAEELLTAEDSTDLEFFQRDDLDKYRDHETSGFIHSASDLESEDPQS